jgi:peroxiredoxin
MTSSARLVGINAREDAPAVVDYARALRLTFSLLLDERGIVSASYGVVGLPTSFLIARDGRAIARAIGAREWTSDPGRALIGALLADRAPGK